MTYNVLSGTLNPTQSIKLASEGQHKGSNAHPVRSLVVDEERMRPGHWLDYWLQMSGWSRWLPHQRTGRDHQGVPVSRGWTPSSEIWEPTTSHWTKQSTWLKTVLCGGWCLRMVLHTSSDPCQKRTRHWLGLVLCVSLSALKLTFGWQEERLACSTNPQVLSSSTGGGASEWKTQVHL